MSKNEYYDGIMKDLENVENKDGHIAIESIKESAKRWNILSKNDFKNGYETALEYIELRLKTTNDINSILSELRNLV